MRVYESKFKPMHYALCDEDVKKPMGMKLVCAGQEERVVGLHVIGIFADEMLQGFGVAMKMGATKADFDNSVAIHPTAAEVPSRFGSDRWSRAVWGGPCA